MFNNFGSKINWVFFEVVCFCKYFVQQKILRLYRLRWNTHYIAKYLFSFHSTHPEVTVRLTALLKICWIPILYNGGSGNAALSGRKPWLRNAAGWRASSSRWVANWQKQMGVLSVMQHYLGILVGLVVWVFTVVWYTAVICSVSRVPGGRLCCWQQKQKWQWVPWPSLYLLSAGPLPHSAVVRIFP